MVKEDMTKEELIVEHERLCRALQDSKPYICCNSKCTKRRQSRPKLKVKLINALTTMARKILSVTMMVAMVLALIALCLPCFLIFSSGNNGELTVWNFVGIGWTCVLAIVLKKVW